MHSHLILRQFWLKAQVGGYGHVARYGHWLSFLLCSMRERMEILGYLYHETFVPSISSFLPLLPRLPGHLEPFYPASIGSMAFLRSSLSSHRCYAVLMAWVSWPGLRLH